MLVAIIPLLVAIIGLVIYAMASNAKAGECGRLMFGAGLLVCLFLASHQTVRVAYDFLPKVDSQPAAYFLE